MKLQARCFGADDATGPSVSGKRSTPIAGKAGRRSRWNNCSTSAFTLLEVMVAVFIFFVAIFAILELMSQNLRLARSLQKNAPTVAMAAAKLCLTNKLEEGGTYGDFEGFYPDYSWTSETFLAGTNGLYRVNVQVLKGGAPFSSMSILLYRPDSVAKSANVPISPFGP